MQAYTGFAMVYDTFMDNVPYEEWTEYLVSLLRDYQVRDGLILELGCGTGNVTRLLRDKGYDMIGIDNSYEMLELARDKEYEDYDDDYEGYEDYDEEDYEDFDNESEIDLEIGKHSILYLEQDMREFELYGTVGAVVSICDSMNYITSKEDLLKVFKLVNNYLDKDGIFIFDMNTEYKYSHILGDSVIAENREDCSFIWENFYSKESKLNEYNVTIYVKTDDENDNNSSRNLFERFYETHYQKAYTIEEIKEILVEAGLEFVAVYDAFTKNKPAKDSERVYFVAKEKTQKNKVYVK